MSSCSSEYLHNESAKVYPDDSILLTDISRYLHCFYVHSPVKILDELPEFVLESIDPLLSLRRDNEFCGPFCVKVSVWKVVRKDVRTKPALFHINTYKLCRINHCRIEPLDSPSQEIRALLYRLLDRLFRKRKNTLELTGEIRDHLVVFLLLFEYLFRREVSIGVQ
jgi:hypothetical protein